MPEAPPLWNVANVLTLIRVALVPFFALALLVDDGEHVGWRLVASGLFALAALTDQVDGTIARRRGLITDFGIIADPIADKLLIGTALVILSMHGDVWWWVTVLILLREVGITVLRFAVIKVEVVAASRGGKLKTVLQTVGVGLFVLPLDGVPGARLVAAAVLGVALVLTLTTGVDYLRGMWRMRTRGGSR